MISPPFESYLGILGYGLSALLFFVFSLLLLTSWRGRLQGGLLLAASLVSCVWAAVSTFFALHPESHHSLSWVLEGLRDLLWLAFLVRLLDVVFPRSGYRALYWPLIVTVTLAVLPWEAWWPALGGWLDSATLRLALFLVLSVGGLVLVEQLYRNTPWEQRWGIKFLCLGLGALFVFDVYFYSDALLLHRLDLVIWQARGLVAALAVPLLAVSAARNPQWSLDLFVSRRIVFHTTAVLAVGIYLLAMALAGYSIRFFGGEWSRSLQIAFLFGALIVLAVLLVSGRVRSQLRVFISKHFFSYKFDYREEWLRITQMLSSGPQALSLGERVVRALGEPVDSPGGALWLCGEEGCRIEARVNLGAEVVPEGEPLGALPQYLGSQGWIIDLEEYARDPDRYDGLHLPSWMSPDRGLWLIVPLAHEGEFLGFVLLLRPRAPQPIEWETLDLLKTAALQAASYLVLERAVKALAEARQFEGFNRLSAFVMHDLKNLIAQLSLVARNAERHKDNPAFIDDAMLTIRNSVERMNRLMAQLKGAIPGRRNDLVHLQSLLQQVVEERKGQLPEPELKELPDLPLKIRTDRERLGAVIGHIVQNAQDAAGRSGHVEVSLRRDGEFARIDIRDDGPGMDQAFIRERLFEPFYSTKGLTGMGIGAHECRDFVRAQGGRVEVDSTPGKGTCFSILLPLGTDQDVDQQPEDPHIERRTEPSN